MKLILGSDFSKKSP
jgi:hypothetical protein